MMKISEKLKLKGEFDERSRVILTPRRIMKKYGDVTGSHYLLSPCESQMTFTVTPCVMRTTADKHAGLLIDFGREFSGSVKLFVRRVHTESGRADIFVRFGESAYEALTPLGEKGTTNDHANREFVINAGILSTNETGESGLRFVYIELLDEGDIELKAVQGVFNFRNVEALGSFECSDEKLNKIWNTAAYTVLLCMQEYLWDGVKRDRLVWMGDMHTEIKTILAAYGNNDIIPRSLDFIKNDTPDGKWMNGIPSYSMWWLIAERDYYKAWGDNDYLTSQKKAIFELTARLIATVGDDGSEDTPDWRFIDWPTSENKDAIHAGLQGLLKMAIDAGGELAAALCNDELSAECAECSEKLAAKAPDVAASKQAAALLALSGIEDAKTMNDTVIAVDGAHRYSAFFGYYILKAKALAGDYQGALDDMRTYWGGMLDMGATTFWEDFDIDWTENALGIDALPSDAKPNIHADFGAYCYKGLRHSLCHGWSSGPCAYISEHVLGVNQIDADTFVIKPELCDLDYARGTYPTRRGVIEIYAENRHGKTKFKVKAPRGIKIKRG
ncbi:MAG: alpha-L-rhamnosidase [Clostridiales bacterium]|nr:alpha-L-rhamnosidase [Clostridiales bacterium]